MPEEIKKEDNGGPIKIFGILLPSIPSIIFRFGRLYLGFKRDANKAGKVFKKELISQGLDKQTASELTDFYLKGSEIKNLINSFR